MIANPSQALEVRELTAAYTSRAVLSSLNLRVAVGEWLGLIGPNASGKTTLLQCVASDNMGLIELARYFLNDDGKPRFHRRLGTADVELDIPG